MTHLTLIGIGTGNPEHLTLQAIRALNAADLILIPQKGAAKSDLAGLRRSMLDEVLTNPATRVAPFDMPERDPAQPDYRRRVADWHADTARIWQETMAAHAPAARVAMMVWGDPSLYDSTLRIAALLPVTVEVIPGITSVQALCAAHAIPLNEVAEPVLITTGRRLRDAGWPDGVDTLVVMLDGDCTFAALPPETRIWWAAYAGMPQQIALSGTVGEIGARIVETRAAARASHGWIMDIYLLRRGGPRSAR